MVRMHNLVDIFDRELEILDVDEEKMIYVLDQKSDRGNLCGIGQYDFNSGEIKTLTSLEGTRLYESFRTYGAMNDYFYAVTVESDYRLRLQEIDSHTWQIRQTCWLIPEGEVLNIYPIHPDYLIVTDEVAATDEILMKFDDEDYAGKYYTLTYLYNLKTGQKWYLHDVFYHMELIDVQAVPDKNGGSQLYFMLQCLNSSGEQENKLWSVSVYYFLASLVEGVKPSFKKIEDLGPDITMARIQLQGGEYGYRLMDHRAGKTDICELQAEDGIVRKNIRTSVSWPEGGDIVYAPEGKGIYHVMETAGGNIRVTDLLKPENSFEYDSKYGDFSGIYIDDMAVTVFYRTQMLKEDMVFKECAAVHHTDEGNADVYEGNVQIKNNQLMLLRSFLYL
ncbi:MAG: hypothetical protein ACI4BB_05225 [Coprococcus sp.]